jgi:hypothetical protein
MGYRMPYSYHYYAMLLSSAANASSPSYWEIGCFFVLRKRFESDVEDTTFPRRNSLFFPKQPMIIDDTMRFPVILSNTNGIFIRANTGRVNVTGKRFGLVRLKWVPVFQCQSHVGHLLLATQIDGYFHSKRLLPIQGCGGILCNIT